jgi:hypothetical protein
MEAICIRRYVKFISFISNTPCARNFISGFVAKVSLKSFRTGEVLFKQGDIMDAIYIVTKGGVRLDVTASSDAFSFICGILRQQFASKSTDELYAMFSATSLEAAAAALIKRFIPLTQITKHREVCIMFPRNSCFIVYCLGSDLRHLLNRYDPRCLLQPA